MSILTTAVTAAVTFEACVMARQEVEEAAAPREGRWIRLRPAVNRGAAFGLPLPPKLLPALSAASLALVLARGHGSPAAAGLILGGGLSNLWERADRGEVLDYLQFPRAPLGRYVYNLADLAILAGGVGALAAGAAGRRRE